jgi:hypothetical protein
LTAAHAKLPIDKCDNTYLYKIQQVAELGGRDTGEVQKNTSQKREYSTLFETATVSTATRGFVSKRNIQPSVKVRIDDGRRSKKKG